jgi:CheY-like chemotaxis protein
MHILLIEPNRILARTYQTALERQGHSVAIIGHAQQAVDRADEHMPDVVVLDLQLPGHSGVEFLYEFRSYPEWQHIPIVLHTFVPPPSLEAQLPLLEQLNVVEYLYKPATSLQKLLRAVSEAVQLHV